jgi:hypothetical protein
MNYLYKNRDNSRKLPFDVMNIIYEYADALRLVKQQIVNKDYDLDEIKYKRMIREIEKYFMMPSRIYAYGYVIHNGNICIEVTPTNMYSISKTDLVYWYKFIHSCDDLYQRRMVICGVGINYDGEYSRESIIRSLEANGHKVNRRYSTKQLYKKWLKL